MNILFIRILLLFAIFAIVISNQPPVQCRNPDSDGKHKRKFLMMGGVGAGVGNFLIFYPAAFWFAAFTGRDILIMDGSLIAEMCKVINCGYPTYDEVSSAFPGLLGEETFRNARPAKVYDFHLHMSGEAPLDDFPLIRADGFKYMSGWYFGRNDTMECVQKLTGCGFEDVNCHDQYAMQKLIKGPFNKEMINREENRIMGVPLNLRHSILSLPHKYSPRLDAAVHLRCQFKHFEGLVGKDDVGWADAMKETNDWLLSTDHGKGQDLFKVMEEKIMENILHIKDHSNEIKEKQSRRLGLKKNNNNFYNDFNYNNKTNNKRLLHEIEEIDSVYNGKDEVKIYVYIASDNEVVKEAFIKYLLGHKNIAVMRVKNNDIIVHAKNLGYLKEAGNNTGVVDMLLDWYALSLSNIVYAWRRDTDLLSTYAHSAKLLSGYQPDAHGEHLFFKHGRSHWKEF